MDSEDNPCTLDQVLQYVPNVKNVRAFGTMLELEPGTLDEIEKDSIIKCSSRINLTVIKWLSKQGENVSDTERWEQLRAALSQPAVNEPEIVSKLIRPQLRRGSSADSAISMASRSSIDSPLPQYQFSFVENIGRKTEECSIRNVLNILALYSEWYDIGVYLDLPVGELDSIMASPCLADHKTHLVELWHRLDPGGFTWKKLCRALKRLVNAHMRKGSTNSQSALLQQSLSTALPTTPEEPIPSLSYFHAQIEPAAIDTALYGLDEVETKVEELQLEFESNQQAMIEKLKEAGVTYEKFKQTVSTFPGSVQLNSLKSLKSLKSVSGEIDMEDIFSILNQKFAWSFLDICLLERIVKRFGSDVEKESMKSYCEKLSSFRKKTTVSNLMYIWTDPNPPLKYSECKKLIARLKWNPDTFTLEQLEKLRKRTHELLKEIPLSEVALVLYRVKHGSIVVTWIVNDDLISQFKIALAQCVRDGVYFRENGVISLELDGQEFKSMEMKLLQVCEEGKVEEVDSVLREWRRDRYMSNEINENGKTALILASEMGHTNIVVSLLEADIDIKIDYQTEDKRWSALFFAYHKKHMNTAKMLLEYGADEHLTDKDGKKPHEASGKKDGWKKKFTKAVGSRLKKLLPSKKKKKNLLSLCECGDLEGVRQLLEGDQQVDIDMQDREHKNWTPLHYACKFGHFEIAQLLVKRGANIEMKASNGWTPLPIACHGNFVRIANMLLKNGADVNATVEKDFSPIMLVTYSTEDDVEPLIRSLLKHGASLEIANARGWTPLMAACDMGRENLVRLFLEHEADPNRQDNVGWTALMAAAKHNEGAIAKLLIESGAKLEMAITKLGKNEIEDHALHVASYMNSPDVVKELIDHGADVNRTNADGLSPLMIATSEDKPEVMEALLKSETIDVDLPHKDTGLPALFVAAQKGRHKIFKRLLQHGAQDEVNGINVMEVASLFKGKDQISKILKKHKLTQMRVKPPEPVEPIPTPTPEVRVKPPERELVAAEAVTVDQEGATLVPEHMQDVTRTTTTPEDVKIVPRESSMGEELQTTAAVTEAPAVPPSIMVATQSSLAASTAEEAPQTVTLVQEDTESVPTVTENVASEVPEGAVSGVTAQDTAEDKVPEQQESQSTGTSDVSSLYGEGEDIGSPPEQKTVAEQDKPRGLLKPQPSQSREEYLKQLLRISDMIYKTSQARMLSFTNNNEFSGKGVKNPNIYHQEPNIVS